MQWASTLYRLFWGGARTFSHVKIFCFLNACQYATKDRSVPHRHRSTSLRPEQRSSHHHTPCGTRAHNLRIRAPTPCPLGQGGSCRSSRGPVASRISLVMQDVLPGSKFVLAVILVAWSDFGVQPLQCSPLGSGPPHVASTLTGTPWSAVSRSNHWVPCNACGLEIHYPGLHERHFCWACSAEEKVLKCNERRHYTDCFEVGQARTFSHVKIFLLPECVPICSQRQKLASPPSLYFFAPSEQRSSRHHTPCGTQQLFPALAHTQDRAGNLQRCRLTSWPLTRPWALSLPLRRSKLDFSPPEQVTGKSTPPLQAHSMLKRRIAVHRQGVPASWETTAKYTQPGSSWQPFSVLGWRHSH